MIWSLNNYKFDNFDNFLGSIIGKFEERIRKDLQRKDELREIFAGVDRRNLERFKIQSRLLRKKPINSIEDLTNYDFLIMHPNFDDCEKVLPNILETYPNKPIILPMGSVGAANHQTYTKDFIVEDVKKDPKYPSVYIVDTNFDAEMSVLTLIEYLLDEKEKVS